MSLLSIQEAAMPTGVLEKYGYPTFVLLIVLSAVGYIGKKWLGPHFARQLARAEDQADAVNKLLTDQLAKSDQFRDTLLRDFRSAIDENNRVSRRVADNIEENNKVIRNVAEKLDRLNHQ